MKRAKPIVLLILSATFAVSAAMSATFALLLNPYTVSGTITIYESVTMQGDGTIGNPYQVSNQAQFRAIDNPLYPNYTLDKHYIQTANITIDGSIPSKGELTGSYNGGGYSIGGTASDKATIEIATTTVTSGTPEVTVTESRAGLFTGLKYVTADPNSLGTIKNLTVKYVSISNEGSAEIMPIATGAIVAVNYYGTIENCNVEGATITAHGATGGIAGIGYKHVANEVRSTITNCTVKSTDITGDGSIGGIIGINDGSVAYCFTDRTTTVKSEGAFLGANNIGGIAGEIFTIDWGGDKSYTPRVDNCINYANVSSVYGGNVGGISGLCRGDIHNSANFGNISSTGYYGGLVWGSLYGNGVGGVVGGIVPREADLSNGGYVSGTYNRGNVSASIAIPIPAGEIAAGKTPAAAGGVFGYVNARNINTSYNQGTVTTQVANAEAGINAGFAGDIGGGSWNYRLNEQSSYVGPNVNNMISYSKAIGNLFGAQSGTTPTDSYYSDNVGIDPLTVLGGAFVADTTNINGGYPILAWQILATPTVEIVDAQAKIGTVDGASDYEVEVDGTALVVDREATEGGTGSEVTYHYYNLPTASATGSRTVTAKAISSVSYIASSANGSATYTVTQREPATDFAITSTGVISFTVASGTIAGDIEVSIVTTPGGTSMAGSIGAVSVAGTAASVTLANYSDNDVWAEGSYNITITVKGDGVLTVDGTLSSVFTKAANQLDPVTDGSIDANGLLTFGYESGAADSFTITVAKQDSGTIKTYSVTGTEETSYSYQLSKTDFDTAGDYTVSIVATKSGATDSNPVVVGKTVAALSGTVSVTATGRNVSWSLEGAEEYEVEISHLVFNKANYGQTTENVYNQGSTTVTTYTIDTMTNKYTATVTVTEAAFGYVLPVTAPTGTKDDIYVHGDGASFDTAWLIGTGTSTTDISSIFSAGNTDHYRLVSDMSKGGTSDSYNTQFKLDGNGYTLSYTGTNWAPIFGTLNAVAHIKNVTIDGTMSRTGDPTALICWTNNGTIDYVKTTGTLYSNSWRFGAFALTNNGIISNSRNEVKINAESASKYIGGIVDSNYGTISNCTNVGSISVGDSGTIDYCAGGIAARNHGSVLLCANTGTILVQWGANGGLVGYNQTGATVTRLDGGAVQVGSGLDIGAQGSSVPND